MKFPIRTPAGSIYLQGRRLWLRFQGERLKTGLLNSPQGIAFAKEKLEQLWRESAGVVPQRTRRAVSAAEAFAEFLADHGRNKAPRTIVQYRAAFRWIFDDGSEKLDRRMIDHHINAYLKRKKPSLATKEINLRTLLTFLNWCARREPPYITSLPRRRDVLPKVPPKRHEVFTAREMKMIFTFFEKSNKKFGLFLQFLYQSGLRVHEALELQWQDISERQIAVLRKDNGDWEYIPRTSHISKILSQLPHDRAKVFPWRRDNQTRIRNWLDEAMRELGIEKRGRSFQTFRSTRVTDLVINGANAAEIKKIMRHSPETAIKHYIEIDDKRAREIAEKTQPWKK